jgi:hypothetical protein
MVCRKPEKNPIISFRISTKHTHKTHIYASIPQYVEEQSNINLSLPLPTLLLSLPTSLTLALSLTLPSPSLLNRRSHSRRRINHLHIPNRSSIS